MFSTLQVVPPGSFLMSRGHNVMQLGILSSIISNGNRIIIELNITPDTYAFRISGKKINNQILGLSDKCQLNEAKIKLLVDLATKITICHGVVKKIASIPNNCSREMISMIGDENTNIEHFRWAKACNEVVRWTALNNVCRRCQKEASKL